MIDISLDEIEMVLPDILNKQIYNPVVIAFTNDEADKCFEKIIGHIENQGISYCCINPSQDMLSEMLDRGKIFIFHQLEKTAGCELLENNFFDIYNFVKTNNNQIIITIKKADINKLQERNKARLRSGITIEIE